MNCRACDAALAEDARFCPSCGEKVVSAEAPPADPLRAKLEKAVGGQYEIVRMLGRGGMGAVYLARETNLDRLVAIKVLPPETSDNAELRERFRREARTAARLTHPNIVPLHSFGESDGTLYYVMGYVRGESLAARLRRDAKLPDADTRRILAEVADALDYAHRQGVVHRDIKPDNVIMDDESGRPMLADFGIAKARDSGGTLTALGSVVGTPTYISPEQASGKGEIDGRSDLYSLGVMGYQMLAGNVPFEGNTARDVLMQHLTKEPPALSEVAPEAPTDVVTAVTRCLAKEPDQRWADGKSFRESLTMDAPMGQEELPDELADLDHWEGGWFLVTILVGIVAVTQYDASELGPGTVWILYSARALPVLALGAVLSMASRARGKGFSWERILTIAFRQPRWWIAAYPVAFRRPGDLWDRLPRELRNVRNLPLIIVPLAAGWFVLLGPAARFVSEALRGLEAELPRPAVGLLAAGTIMVPFLALFFFVWGIPMWRFTRWARRHGLDQRIRDRIQNASTSNPTFWKRPDIAPLLLPDTPATAMVPEPTSPREYLQAIQRRTPDLSGMAREAGTRATAVARELLSQIEALEREIGELRMDVETANLKAIEARLEALGPAEDGEDDDTRDRRELLTRQRDLSQRLAARLEEKAARRSHVEQLMQQLWGEVEALHAAGTPTPPDAGDALRALCARAELEAKGTSLHADDGLAGLEELPTMEAPSPGEEP